MTMTLLCLRQLLSFSMVELKALERMFDVLDLDGDGTISEDELGFVLTELGIMDEVREEEEEKEEDDDDIVDDDDSDHSMLSASMIIM
jgi:Ca2+-binding EF-hand superfamily protein